MKVLFWVVACLDLACSAYLFVENPQLQAAMFLIYAALLLLECIFMLVALCKMRVIIGTWRRGMVNTKRMISHASAFILSILALVYDESMNYYGS